MAKFHKIDTTELLHIDYFTNEKSLKHRLTINERSKSLGESEFTYRIINHWEKNGLIDVDRGDNGKGWRKYSLMDVVWISIIAQLRKFGASIVNIKKIKEQVQNYTSYYGPSKYTNLEFYCSMYMMFKKPTYAIVFDNYDIEFVTSEELESIEILNENSDYIKINLHTIINKIFKKDKSIIIQESKFQLSDEEQDLLIAIRTGNYKSINIKMKNDKITYLEKTKEETEETLRKILSEKSYGTITIEKVNGKIVNINNEIKVKF